MGKENNTSFLSMNVSKPVAVYNLIDWDLVFPLLGIHIFIFYITMAK